jgi:hypothetical protein
MTITAAVDCICHLTNVANGVLRDHLFVRLEIGRFVEE